MDLISQQYILLTVKCFYSRSSLSSWTILRHLNRFLSVLSHFPTFKDILLFLRRRVVFCYGIFYRKNNHFHNVPWPWQAKWLKPKLFFFLFFLFAGINFLCVRNACAAPDLSGAKEAVGGFPRPSIIRNCLLLGILPSWFCSGRSEKFGITLPCLWRGVWSLCAACSCWEWLVGSVCALIARFCRNPQWNSPNPPGFMLDWSPWTPSN